MRRVALALSLVALACPVALAQRVVTAAQVNGTWRSKTGEIKVLALGGGKLRVEFDGTYEYTQNGMLLANTGVGTGVAAIEGDTATFRPEDAEEECLITLRFADGKLVVTQQGACGFGLNVTADGEYRRVSARKPTFDED